MRLSRATWRLTLALAVAGTLVVTGALAYAGEPAAGPHGPVPLVTVTVPQRAGQAIIDAGLDVAAVRPVEGGCELDIVLGDDERAYLDQGRLRYTVKDPDLTDDVEVNLASYRNLSDYLNEMAQIAASYPTLARRFPAGISIEGRTIYGLELSSPVTAQDGRPECYFDGIHHAREWPSGEYCMNLAWDLVQKYGVDAQITNLMNSTRIWIVPVQNPDGFYYSQNTYNLWRKNRRLNSGGSYGVDTNRNYAYWWGGAGSSAVQSSPNYRGTAPVSEPECQAIRNIFLSHQIITMITNHTYGNLVLWPWGYTTADPPDATDLSSMGNAMAGYNGYTPMQSADRYSASGCLIDWVYGTGGTYAYHFEHGTEFQPPYSTVNATYIENYPAFMYLAERADYQASVLTGSITDAATGQLIPATLELRRQYVVPRSNGSVVYETTVTTLYTATGSYNWHVHPSKMPRESTNPGYTLTVSSPGYQYQTLMVKLGRRETRAVDVALNR